MERFRDELSSEVVLAEDKLRTVFLWGFLFDLGLTVQSVGYCSIWGLLWGLHYSTLRLDLAVSIA